MTILDYRHESYYVMHLESYKMSRCTHIGIFVFVALLNISKGSYDIVGHKGLAFAEDDVVCTSTKRGQECVSNPCQKRQCGKCFECIVSALSEPSFRYL